MAHSVDDLLCQYDFLGYSNPITMIFSLSQNAIGYSPTCIKRMTTKIRRKYAVNRHVNWFNAVYSCNLEVMKQLLDKNLLLVEAIDPVLTFTAMHWGAKLGRIDMMQLLTLYSCDPNIKTEGHTPLHTAYIYNKSESIKYLINLPDIDLEATDVHDLRPRDYAYGKLYKGKQNESNEGKKNILNVSITRNKILPAAATFRNTLRKSMKSFKARKDSN